eukprot:CAMPEP_0178414674 /NCGR_PEP_ID=MMETSP0689_2-20121128/23157_1 /TAXON_ID=160604 /ORGANISM="Amphidinium massartii, Strain CS-259" /LENGTH=231 /DNA_ID=CAMNT_0020035969 /DNA_START=78 /DNA_END=773 /DNA_ORIENTATION=-
MPPAGRPAPVLGPSDRLTSTQQLRSGLGVLAVLAGQANRSEASRPAAKAKAAAKRGPAKAKAGPKPKAGAKAKASPAPAKRKATAQVTPPAKRSKVSQKGTPDKPDVADRRSQRLQADAEKTRRSPRAKAGAKAKPTAQAKRMSRKQEAAIKASLDGVSKPDFRRLARRSGCRRMAALIYDEGREALKEFLEKVLGDVTTYVDYRGQKTATTRDVVASLRRQGRILYGHNG